MAARVRMPLPGYLEVEIGTYCNRRCAWCPNGSHSCGRRHHHMSEEVWRALLDDLRGHDYRGWFAFHDYNEPLANPRFDEVLAICREVLPDASWLLQTNGDALTAENFDELRHFFSAIAINFYDERSAKRFAALGLAYVAAEHPGRIQHPGRLRRAPGQNRGRGEAVVQLNHKNLDTSWIELPVEAGQVRAPCTHLWRDAAVGHDGLFYLCCRDSQREHPLADLRQTSLVEAYNGPVATAPRQSMQAGSRDRIAMCPHRHVPGTAPSISARLSTHARGLRPRSRASLRSGGVLAARHRRRRPRPDLAPGQSRQGSTRPARCRAPRGPLVRHARHRAGCALERQGPAGATTSSQPAPASGRAVLACALADLDEGQELRASSGGLCGQQWIGALLDFPALEPTGVRVSAKGVLRTGALAAWAAVRAGRASLQVHLD
ncbi:MAG: radical SAM/SPASM domain-containing protein [Pseudomonadota bacterium]